MASHQEGLAAPCLKTAMPMAQSALFALRDLDPRLADAVLERAATYYHGGDAEPESLTTTEIFTDLRRWGAP